MEFTLTEPVQIYNGAVVAKHTHFQEQKVQEEVCYAPDQMLGGWLFFEEDVQTPSGTTSRGQLLPGNQPFSSCAKWITSFMAPGHASQSCKIALDDALSAVERNEATMVNATSPADRKIALSAGLKAAINGAACKPADFAGFVTPLNTEEENEQWFATCSSQLSVAMAAMLADRVAFRAGILRGAGMKEVDFTKLTCVNETKMKESAGSQSEVKSDAFAIDLAFSLDGTCRAEVAPNKQSGSTSGNEVFSATRSGGAISDGLNSIVIDDVPITAVVRQQSQKTFRYRQVIHVNQSCVVTRGHPCMYPSADANKFLASGKPAGRQGPCQRSSEHGQRWFDVNPALDGAKVTKPFKVLVDTYHLGPADSSAPTSLSTIHGASVRGVHSQCEEGTVGSCPQDSNQECTSPFQFNALPIAATVPSAGVTEKELEQAPRSSRRGSQWAVPRTHGIDMLAKVPEYVQTAIIKDFKPQSKVGESYETAQVLLSGVPVNADGFKPEDAGPGETRFENHRYTEAYFRCIAILEEIEEM